MAEIIYRGVNAAPAPNGERIESRVEKERADRLEMENEILRGELLSLPLVIKEIAKGFMMIRARILGSNLEPAEQDELLNSLVAIKKNAIEQRPPIRFLRRRNG